MTYQELIAERERLKKRILELEEENARLRTKLGEGDFEKQKTSIKQILSLQDKVELFRKLFKGREDVFARRWYSKTTGKAGYQPVCANEWNSQFCDKKKYRCAECPNRQFSVLTYDDVYRHLAGKDDDGRDVIGLYAILDDNTCNFLCADFDDKNCEYGYQNDVLEFVGVCKNWGIPCSIERSRSGNGAHVWIFFETPIAAAKVRKMGNMILTEAMNKNSRISFKSYDRFFPNQDFLPEGGLGNLVALPLQGKSRKEGNSVFVNEHFVEYPEQWEYLLHIKRLSENKLEELIKQNANEPPMGELSKTSEAKPWEIPAAPIICADDFTEPLNIVRSNMLYVPLKSVSPKVINHLKRIAAFKNPEFYTKQAMRLSTFTTPRIISCAELYDEYLALPRGCENAVCDFLRENNISCRWTDKTNHGKSISISFRGELRKSQADAVKALSKVNNGVLSATTAFGKTVTAIGLIAEVRVNTLIIVHTKALLDQWKRELEKFLSIDCLPENELSGRGRKKKYSPIGTYSSTGNSLHGIIDVATIQSCFSDNEVKPFVRDYGMVIADECHHVSAISFEQVMKAVNAHHVYGLTATPIRKDGHQPIIFMQCGPIRYCADAKQQIQSQTFRRMLIPRFTSCRMLTADRQSYAQIIQELATDEYRNQQIFKDVCSALSENRSPIILTSLTAHVIAFCELLKPHCKNIISLVGSESAKEKRQKQELLQSIPATEPLVIVATGKYVGEGFDCPRLDTLFLALPVSWKGIVAQYAGRLHRDYPGKEEVQIYDYIDIRFPICDAMYRRRIKGYAAVGYSIKSEEALFGHSAEATEIIFDGQTFLKPFITSLSKARKSIILSCPKVKLSRYSLIADRLRDLVPNGIDIYVFTREENEATKLLESYNIQVTIKPELNINCAVIDKAIIWYGGICILGYHSVSENIMTFNSAETANCLIEVLFK